MADKPAPDRRAGFLARLNMLETLVLAAICLVAIAGLMLVGKGFYIKANADLPPMPLGRSFEMQTHRETNVSRRPVTVAFIEEITGHMPVKSV